MRLSRAKKLRKIIEQTSETLEDEVAATVPELFEAWEPDVAYAIGKRVSYNDKLYKVLQAHTSHEAYQPDIAVSLYAVVLIPDPSVIPEWVQPESTNPYMKGDKVRHDGKIWVSDIDYNVFEPGVAGWSEVSG